MRSTVPAVVVLIHLCAAAPGQERRPGETPRAAATTADVLKAVEAMKGFGVVRTAEFRAPDEQTFVVAYNPYSGAAKCHVHGYRFDPGGKQWVRFPDRTFDGTHDVAVEGGARLTIRDVKGNVIYRDGAKE